MPESCSQCQRPSYTMKWSEETKAFVHFCRQHSPPHLLIEVAEFDALRAERKALAARVATLTEALQPFATLADVLDASDYRDDDDEAHVWPWLTTDGSVKGATVLGDLRQARRALACDAGQEGGKGG